jgi:O-antigen/teichoic acid export membrane protein
MPEYKLFAQRVGLIGITNLLVNLRGLILIPILTKTLGAEGYGLWAQVIVTIALITPLVTLGLSSAMIRFLAAERDKKEIQEGFYSSSVLIFFGSVLASAILFIFSEPIAASLFGGATDIVKLIVPFICQLTEAIWSTVILKALESPTALLTTAAAGFQTARNLWCRNLSFDYPDYNPPYYECVSIKRNRSENSRFL